MQKERRNRFRILVLVEVLAQGGVEDFSREQARFVHLAHFFRIMFRFADFKRGRRADDEQFALFSCSLMCSSVSLYAA